MAGEAAFWGIAAGDWLQAGASFLGVGATILGTLFIERRMRNAGDREDVSRIREVVGSMADAATAIRDGLPDDATNYDHFAKSLGMQTALKSSFDMYRFVRADTKVKNLQLWRALRALDDVLSNHGKIAENELQIFISDGNHTRVFDINRAKVMAASVPIDEAARAVLAIDA